MDQAGTFPKKFKNLRLSWTHSSSNRHLRTGKRPVSQICLLTLNNQVCLCPRFLFLAERSVMQGSLLLQLIPLMVSIQIYCACWNAFLVTAVVNGYSFCPGSSHQSGYFPISPVSNKGVSTHIRVIHLIFLLIKVTITIFSYSDCWFEL